MKTACPVCNGTGDFAASAPAPVPFIPCATCRATGEVDALCLQCKRPALFSVDGEHFCSLVCQHDREIELTASLAGMICDECGTFRLPELGCYCKENA